MIRSGLVSITFRKLNPAEIVRLTARAGLSAIEWGGDVHVPHGDTGVARSVGRITTESGIAVSSYGSYYRVGESEQRGLAFEQVLESCCALGAPLIRVWAGKRPSAEADNAYRQTVEEDTLRIARMAAAAGKRIAFEYHANTLTDSPKSTDALLEAVAGPSVGCYWQPPVHMTHGECMEALGAVRPYLSALHVFSWIPRDDTVVRLPLEEGRDEWLDYLATVFQTGSDLYALLEFVRDNEPEQFLRDAASLLSWLQRLDSEAE